MKLNDFSNDPTWWFATLPALLGHQNLPNNPSTILAAILGVVVLAVATWLASSGGGAAWRNGRNRLGRVPLTGPSGWPVFGSLFALSRGLAHRTLADLATARGETRLMAFSVGSTPFVVASEPNTAREILTSPHFADRPVKQSARLLMFTRAIGFAPNGAYWRLLRRIASSHLFAPRRILAHEPNRQLDCTAMMKNITADQTTNGSVVLRKHLQFAALNNIMGSVFGKRYDPAHDSEELAELKDMVNEGFDLLGAFNWSDYLPWLCHVYDPFRVNERCSRLVPRVRRLVRHIIDEHRAGERKMSDEADFVDVLLSLDGDEKLNEDDMVAVLWEMIFRGTDTSALLTEWAMAELVLNPPTQARLRSEIDCLVGPAESVTDADVAKMPYLQAVVKETLRTHPPGPLLSWARLSRSDVQLSNGMVVPANTTAMVNMWAIAHDPHVWPDPNTFRPERFLEVGGDVDVRGGDTRLAPFGAGRRVCPGKNLGLVTVSLWVAKLVRCFEWAQDESQPVDLAEVLKLSCEMKCPLRAVAAPRSGVFADF